MNYPAFNGQFSDIIFSTGEGVFLKDEDGLLKILEAVRQPAAYNTKLSTKFIIDKPETFS